MQDDSKEGKAGELCLSLEIKKMQQIQVLKSSKKVAQRNDISC